MKFRNILKIHQDIWIIMLLCFVFLVGCSIEATGQECNNDNLDCSKDEINTAVITTPGNISEVDPFLILVGENLILNDSLVLSSNEEVMTLSDQIDEFFILDIHNYSDENILFSNMEFNVRAFKKVKATTNSSTWEEVILPNFTPNEEVVLYTDSTSNIGINVVAILVRMIQELEFEDNVRFFVSGIGEESGNSYGAYVDILLVQNMKSD